MFLWEGLDEAGRAYCKEVMHARTDWVVWSRSNAPKHATQERPFEHCGVPLFQGRAKLNASEDGQSTPGRSLREKGWWRRGAVETNANSVNMTCWVHEDQMELVSVHKEALTAAWMSTESKEICEVCLTGPEKDFWLGTEVGLLGGYGFQGATFGSDGSNSDGAMGAGCCCLETPTLDHHARVGREVEGTSSARPELGGLLLALHAVHDDKDALILSDNESVLNRSDGG